MAKKLKILYCSPEVTPFSKTGGLADVAGSLPPALAEISCDIRIMTPKYAGISDSGITLNKLIESLSFPIGKRSEEGGLYEGRLPDSNVPVFFVSNDQYFSRKELYQKNGKDYEDNLERFSFFAMAVLYFTEKLGWQPDVIHCNDWQTSLIPVYLKTIIRQEKSIGNFYKKSGTLLTIHNVGYQGLFSRGKFPATGLGWDVFNINGLEYYGNINLLKGGLLFSDILNTVSPTYSREIQSEDYGYGLDGVLRLRSKDLFGILNGVDYMKWSPSTDKHLAARYSVRSITKKKKCKQDLQRHCGLTVTDVPLIGLISRLDDHKGFDNLVEIMDELMQLEIQMVILGQGKPKYHEILRKFTNKYPENISVTLSFDDTLAHKIEAGADIFLMPSKYEPCGLNQLYSLKYGTVPVAHKTGGLADTITDCIPSNIVSDKATGFLYSHYSSDDLLKTILLAIYAYKDQPWWNRVVTAGMKSDFSWKQSATEYVKLYKKVLERVKTRDEKGGVSL